NAAAAELLTVCALLSTGPIPETFFIEGASSLGPTFEALAAEPFAFQAPIKATLSYSLLQRNPAEATVSVHRLVQAVLKGRLSEAARRVWARRVIEAMTRLFPTDERTLGDYWQICERLLSHSLVCLALCEEWRENEALSINLMNRIAAYLCNR